MDRVSLSHDYSGNEKKLLKSDINGLQEALVFQDTHKKKSFTSRLLGEKEHFKWAEMGIASDEAEFFFLSGSVNELIKSVYNHPNILRHESVSQC